ncbi:hypothetical protein [Prauserella flavalba]|uniref:hypothetical protein n=1 Tax=Prauserella flavalba TaxID=1477506 RepID=UPI0036E40E14
MAKTFSVKFTQGDASWRLDFHKVTVDEAIELRRLTGVRWAQLVWDLEAGDALALKTFLWLARRQAGETLEFDDPSLNFAMMDVEWKRLDPVVPEAELEPEPEAVAEEAPDPTGPPATPRTSRKK